MVEVDVGDYARIWQWYRMLGELSAEVWTEVDEEGLSGSTILHVYREP